MKILISAYSCEPDKGSEPAVGWNQVIQAAREHDLWVITRANNRPAVDQALALKPLPRVNWIFVDLPRWASLWKNGLRGMRTYYYIWQFAAYWRARKLNRQVRFDVIHHVTFVNYWMPTFMALLPVPFVWGPVGGGESAPIALRKLLSLRGRAYEVLRDLARRVSELNPLVLLTARKATIALAATEQTADRLRELGCKRVTVLSQVALPEAELQRLIAIPPPSQNGPFRVLSIGRLLHLKGLDYGLEAFARFYKNHRDAEFWIVGDGQEAKRLKRKATTLNIAESVKFHGAVARSQVFEMLAQSHVLLFPCLHDSGGWASVEALASGRPVICLDIGGPAHIVSSVAGIKVEAITAEQVIADLASALEKCESNRLLVEWFGVNGRERVKREFTWDKKGRDLSEIYSRTRQDETEAVEVGRKYV